MNKRVSVYFNFKGIIWVRLFIYDIDFSINCSNFENEINNTIQMENDDQSTRKIIIGTVLLIVILLLGGYTVYQNNQLNKSNAFLEEEKETIEAGLDAMVKKYDLAISENSVVSEELKLEREDITLLRDSVKNLKTANYSIIRRYRNKIAALEASNKELFQKNDSLRIVNNILAKNLSAAVDSIMAQNNQLNILSSENELLNEKVGVGAQLKVNAIKVVSMKKRLFNSKLGETSRASRTDALRINFVIAANDLAEKSQRNVKMQVISPKGVVIHVVGTAVGVDGQDFDYSDETTVDYDNDDLGVITLLEVDRKTMLKGTYKVCVYVDNKLVAISGFLLD